MVSKQVTIKNSQGLHMRPAGLFTKSVTKFASDVTIVFNGNHINGKSIMNVIAAGIKAGSVIEIQCDGSDEQEALDAAINMIENGLEE